MVVVDGAVVEQAAAATASSTAVNAEAREHVTLMSEQ
jgi:hypothetical protein